MYQYLKPYTFKISSYAGKVLRKVADKVPSVTISNPKTLQRINWIGEHISSPQNRLILGISALLSQPFIDLSNKRVDEETRKTSAARTVAKIIAGTTTGFLVRYGAIELVDKMTKVPLRHKPMKKWETFLSPDRMRVVYRSLGQYKKTIGTLLAIVVMVATNFLVDAPLTKFLTNKFISAIHKRDEKKSKINDSTQTHSPTPKPKETKDGSTNLIKIKMEELQKLNAETNKEVSHG